MDADRPLFWHQGLFLQPQHLQLLDLSQRSLLKPLLDFGRPHFWGVTALGIQEPALANRSFEVLSGGFIFQDGTYVTVPGNGVIAPRKFDEADIQSDRPITVFVGLRKLNRAGTNTAVVDEPGKLAAQNTRSAALANPEVVPDLHAGGPAGNVKRLQYVLRVFWESEEADLDDWNLIAVARLERNGDDIRLMPHFVPPSLTLNTSEFLVKAVKDIRDQVSARCRQLEAYKSPGEIQSLDFDLGYIVFLLALRSLNRYVPLLEHLGENPAAHPFVAYGLIRQIVGELSTFSETLSATGERLDGTVALPAYDHTNLWFCYSSVRDLVTELLDGITVGPGHRIRLEPDGRFFTGSIPENLFSTKFRYWLILQTHAPADQVTQAMQRLVKLSAKRHITTLIARAITGIPLTHYPVPPPGLPRKPYSHYYQIDAGSPQWQDVGAAGQVSLFWDSAPDDLTAEILIMRG